LGYFCLWGIFGFFLLRGDEVEDGEGSREIMQIFVG
jgi:hypothetical protein